MPIFLFEKNPEQTTLARSLLVYIDKVKVVGAFSLVDSFSWNKFNNEVTYFSDKCANKADCISGAIGAILTKVRKGEKPEIRGKVLRKLENFCENQVQFVIDETFDIKYERNELDSLINSINEDKKLPSKFIQDLFNDVFKQEEEISVDQQKPLPDYFIDSKICKTIEFDSENLSVCVITATLNWATHNMDKIFDAALTKESNFRYILTGNVGSAPGNKQRFQEEILQEGLQNKIKILQLNEVSFKTSKNSLSFKLDSMLLIPIANDMVIYNNVPEEIITKFEEYSFKQISRSERKDSIALIGTSPLAHVIGNSDPADENYYDIAINHTVGKDLFLWFNQLWKNLEK